MRIYFAWNPHSLAWWPVPLFLTPQHAGKAPPLLQHSPPPLFNMSEQGSRLKAAILVVSDTASKDPSTDRCIPTLTDVFGTIGDNQWEVTETAFVQDDVLAIQKTIKNWSDGPEPVNLIVTSGGTGFAIKDVTPEVRVLQNRRKIRLRTKGSYVVARSTCSRPGVSCIRYNDMGRLISQRHGMLMNSFAVTPCLSSADLLYKLRLTDLSCIDGSTRRWHPQEYHHSDLTWITKGSQGESGGNFEATAACLHPSGWR